MLVFFEESRMNTQVAINIAKNYLRNTILPVTYHSGSKFYTDGTLHFKSSYQL